MSSRTLTNTAWGEMARDVDDDGAVTITSLCKVCAGTNVQRSHHHENAFQVVRPKHKAGCRFHPDALTPIAPSMLASVPRIVGAGVSPAVVWALLVVLVILAFLGGWAL